MQSVFVEIVQDFDCTYYANLIIDGALFHGLKENVSYETLKADISEKCDVALPRLGHLSFKRLGRKHYAEWSTTTNK